MQINLFILLFRNNIVVLAVGLAYQDKFLNESTLLNQQTHQIMKYLLCCLVILLFFSCGKISNKIGEDYFKVVGRWKNISGDENIEIVFSKRGKVSIEREFARGGTFFINNFDYVGPSNSGLLSYSFMVKSKKYNRFGYSDALYLFANDLNNFDTIALTGFWLVENSTYQYSNVLFVKE